MAEKKPIMDFKRILKIGRSYYISIPKEWLEAHDIELPGKDTHTELLMVADKDIRIVNPEHVADVYKEVSKVVKGAKV